MPMLGGLEQALAGADGFDSVMLRYRVAMLRSVLDFIRAVRADHLGRTIPSTPPTH